MFNGRWVFSCVFAFVSWLCKLYHLCINLEPMSRGCWINCWKMLKRCRTAFTWKRPRSHQTWLPLLENSPVNQQSLGCRSGAACCKFATKARIMPKFLFEYMETSWQWSKILNMTCKIDMDGFLWLTMASWSMSQVFFNIGMAWREERVLNITYYPIAVFRVRPVTRCTSSLSGHIEAWDSEKKTWTSIWTTLDNDIQRSWKICVYI